MNILHLIGNGFDINLGMNTSYRDFYKYYQTIPSTSNKVSNLKNNIAGNLKNWSDLELALGKYTSKIGTPEDFDEIFYDIEDNLAEYLQEEENKFDFGKTDIEKFQQDLIAPERFLQPADRSKITAIRSSKNSQNNKINIITFNYTKSIEHILGANNKSPIFVSKNMNKYQLDSIHHIHGFTDRRMVMGVNDVSQITNTSFHSNIDIRETLVKNDCNKIVKDNIEIKCKQLVSSADLVCIFGCSIGDTDKLWWELISEKLIHQPLIIFEKGEEIPIRRMHLRGRRERNIRNYFLSKTSLTKEEKEKRKNNIYVGINTKIFNLIKK